MRSGVTCFWWSIEDLHDFDWVLADVREALPILRTPATTDNENQDARKRPPERGGLGVFALRSLLAECLEELGDGAVEVLVVTALFVDLRDRVHDRGVVLAAELTADLRQR